MSNSISFFIIPGLVRYIVHGEDVGNFLTAVLENDLHRAVLRADLDNRRKLSRIVLFLDSLDFKCWGSVEQVKQWKKHKGLKGMEDLSDEEVKVFEQVLTAQAEAA